MNLPTITPQIAIQAFGQLFSTYRTDLVYFHNFKQFQASSKQPELRPTYLEARIGSFKGFLNEYRVARNVSEHRTDDLLFVTLEWVKAFPKNLVESVDEFAKVLAGTGIPSKENAIMTSLAAKVLYLADPLTVMPIDSLARKALGGCPNNYSEFRSRLLVFERENDEIISHYLEEQHSYLKMIEHGFDLKKKEARIIRRKRYTDKLLWTIGKRKGKEFLLL